MKPETEHLDPRIRRTRQMLCQALAGLLAGKSFDEISVQDIADRSTINRATFYDHFTDKFALLEGMIDEDFRALFEDRMRGSDGTCCESQKQLLLAVCDFLAQLGKRCQTHQRQFAPVVEARIKAFVRDFLITGLRKGACGSQSGHIEVRATMAAWAIYGAAWEWNRQAAQPAELFVPAILPHISAILESPAETASTDTQHGH